MNIGLFGAQLNTCWDLLQAADLLEYREYFPGPNAFVATKKMSYIDTWVYRFSNSAFTFLLKDNSLLDFRLNRQKPLHVNYSYYECPFQATSYEEFLIENFELKPENISRDLAEIGDRLRPEYEVHLLAADRKDAVTPVRYDIDYDAYKEGRHPVGHFHFGFNSDIRVSTRKKLRPASFLLFVIRQFYPDKWVTLLGDMAWQAIFSDIRDNLDDIEKMYFKPNDLREMTLH